MDRLIEMARGLLRAKWTVEQVRRELRSTVLDCGDTPTCSSVEEAIAEALE